VPAATLHVHPTAPLAERALLPGDPGRALVLAQSLLQAPKMFNHNCGLWGYTGTAADGEALTIQSTGMGGPSAAIVLEELATLGLRRAVRIGTCGALAEGLAVGALVCATEVLGADGTSRALGAPERQAPDAALTGALREHTDHEGLVVSSDLFYDADHGRARAWARAGALAVEMEAATLLAVGARRGVAVACALAVTGSRPGGGERIGDEALKDAAERLGRAGFQALRA
jgi:uridine phosphorylase